MFTRFITHKQVKLEPYCLIHGGCSRYGSVDNLKLIHRSGWTFFTILKRNRKVSVSRDIGYQHLDDLIFDEQALVQGLVVKLQKLPFQVKLFKMVTTDGRIEWIVTNDLDQTVNQFVAELKNDNRRSVAGGGFSQRVQTVDWFRKVSVPKSMCAEKSFSLLLSCLGFVKTTSQTARNNNLSG